MKVMNRVNAVILACGLAAASLAAADTVRPTYTFEALAKTIRMPVSTNGTIALRECAKCDVESVRVTPLTQYRLNQTSMRLDEFRDVMQELTSGNDITVNITRDEASNTVIAVFVYTQ